MANMTKTLIIVLLDESSSMRPKKSEVLDGFNAFIDEQKQVTTDQGRLYLIKFNTSVNVVHNGLDLKNVPALTDQTYSPGGYTALYDAIAEGVSLGEKGKSPDERVICVIMTDGEENSSRKTTKQQVKDLISGHETRGDWTFIYIGQNPEQWAVDTGMPRLNVVPYNIQQPFEAYADANFACNEIRECSAMESCEDMFSSARVNTNHAVRNRRAFLSRRTAPTVSATAAANTQPKLGNIPVTNIPPNPFPVGPFPTAISPLSLLHMRFNQIDVSATDVSFDTPSFEIIPTPTPTPNPNP